MAIHRQSRSSVIFASVKFDRITNLHIFGHFDFQRFCMGGGRQNARMSPVECHANVVFCATNQSRDLGHTVWKGVYPLYLVVEVEMVETAHLLLLEPDAVPVPVQAPEVGLLLPEDVLPGLLLLMLEAVAVGRLLGQAVGGRYQALGRGKQLLFRAGVICLLGCLYRLRHLP